MRTIFREKLSDFANFYNEIMPIAKDMISEKMWRIYKELDKSPNNFVTDKSWFDKDWELCGIANNEITFGCRDFEMYGDELEDIPFWAFENKENWYEQCIASERASRRAADDINRDIRKKNAQASLEAAQRELDRLNNPDAQP